MGIIGAITMPLFFASNALYPIDMMPEGIKHLAIVNPLTYVVDALRKLLTYNSYEVLADIAITSIFVLISVAAALKMLSKIIE